MVMQILMISDEWMPVLLAGAALLVAVLVWWGLAHRAREGSPKAGLELALPRDLTLTPRPLMTDMEATLYNLIRVAVQDQYLVFVQVPLLCLVQVRTKNQRVRRELLRHIALKRLDFVLVHPGTLQVAKAIELDGVEPRSSAEEQARDRVIDATLNRAGIELVRLPADERYTLPALAALLGLEPL